MAADVSPPPPEGFVIQNGTPPLPPEGFVIQNNAPKMPDMSGVHAAALQNMQPEEKTNSPSSAAVENPEEKTFSSKLDQAAGMPISGTIGNAKGQVALPSDMRGHLMDSYDKGTSTDISDFMHSVLHTIVPIAARGVAGAQNAYEPFQPVVSNIIDAFKTNFEETGKAVWEPYDEKGVPWAMKPADVAVKTAGKIGNAVGGVIGSLFGPMQGAATAGFEQLVPSLANGLKKLAGDDPRFKNIDTLSHEQIHNVASEMASWFTAGAGGAMGADYHRMSTQFPEGAGPWAHAPDQFKEFIGAKVGKPAASVTDSDIVQAIRMGYGEKGIPAAEDFHATAKLLSDSGTKNLKNEATVIETEKQSESVPQQEQDVFTAEDAVIKPKTEENIYAGDAAKTGGMDADAQKLRLDSLNKKMEAAIITPKEMAEREALSAKVVTSTLRNVYKETGVPPDQVLTDARVDPRVAEDIRAGEIPEIYKTNIVPETQVENAAPIPKDLTPEHQEVQDKFGTPETMNPSQLGRLDKKMAQEFAEQAKNPTYSDEQFNALEGYARRVELARDRAAVSPSKQIRSILTDQSGALTVPDSAKEFAADIKRDILNFTTPMETGSDRARASAKDFANKMRWAQWNGARILNLLNERFSPPELKTMWESMDQASVHAQMLESNGMSRDQAMLATEKANIGHFALPDEQREIIKALSDWASYTWDSAKRLEMVKGDGLPFWTPRMAAVIGEDGSWRSPAGGRPSVNTGKNLSTTAGSLKGRKYLTAAETEAAMQEAFGGKTGDQAQLVRDIRTMPLALTRLEQAIGGRALISEVKKLGSDTGAVTVKDTPSEGYFTLDHPAFQTYRPKLKMDEEGKWQIQKDAEGNDLFEKQPIYISKEFEGPLKAVLSQDSSAAYKALMKMKSESMSLIMYSPIIHNAVEWGRALPAMPGKVATFKIYFEGNALKNGNTYQGVVPHIANWLKGDLKESGHNPEMKEAIDGGLVPIGSRFFNQDISSIIETPNLTPGRSWQAKLLGGIVGEASPKAGEAVKAAIDSAGDFWHNTLLWDRIGDLQAGIYKNIRDQAIESGMERQAAVSLGAHIANRFAGALPMESMSNSARKMANIVMFSRSFTLGNLGVMKDMFKGLPSDVLAQLERDVGAQGAKAASKAVQRKAIAAFTLDIALMYVGNSLLQDTFDKMHNDKDWGQLAKGYVDRLHNLLAKHAESPWELLNIPADLQSISSTSTNEPGKENRILFSTDPEKGTNSYVRFPVGKMGEEFEGWATSPLETLRKKLSPQISPLVDIYRNEDFFGHPIYDKTARGVSGMAENLGKVVEHFMKAQIPADAVETAYKTLTGQSRDKGADTMKVAAPLVGLTISKGYPGGAEAGILAATSRRHEAEISGALPKIKEAVEAGDEDKAKEIMNSLEMPAREQAMLTRHYNDPQGKINARSLRKFEQIATPEEKELMEQQGEKH